MIVHEHEHTKKTRFWDTFMCICHPSVWLYVYTLTFGRELNQILFKLVEIWARSSKPPHSFECDSLKMYDYVDKWHFGISNKLSIGENRYEKEQNSENFGLVMQFFLFNVRSTTTNKFKIYVVLRSSRMCFTFYLSFIIL